MKGNNFFSEYLPASANPNKKGVFNFFYLKFQPSKNY